MQTLIDMLPVAPSYLRLLLGIPPFNADYTFMEKFKESIRHKTRRTQGQSMEAVIAEINPKLRGWFEYFKHSHRNVMGTVDGWVRMRLRSILRKHQGKRGKGQGSDHQKWPNDYFENLGYFSLEKARRLALHSR